MRYGALIGDIAGSRFEGVLKDFFDLKFFPQEDEWYDPYNTDCSNLRLEGRFTDDSVLTLAVAEAILLHRKTGEPLEQLAVKQMQEKGRTYAHRGFGGAFYDWMFHSDPQPYGSYGNGAAMRVSPCAWLADNYKQAIEYARTVTNVTHNHPDSIWGAEVVVTAIWTLKETKDKERTAKYISKKYGLDPDEIRNSKFQINCKQAVSLAFKAFMESRSFNETIHRAINYGGDTDTLAAIAGSIAEAYYPIDADLIEQAKTFFNESGVSPDWEEPVALEYFKAFTDWKEPERKVRKFMRIWKGD